MEIVYICRQIKCVYIMKHLFICLLLFISCAFTINAQETAKSLYSTEIERKVSMLDFEGHLYTDVVVKLKSNSVYGMTDKVKVKIVNSEGKLLLKKTFKNSCLFVFSSGQVQVGKDNFSKLVITKSFDGINYIGIIREKEGVY